MKRNLCIYVVVFVVVVPALYAAEPGHSSPYVQGTVILVQQRKIYSPDSTDRRQQPVRCATDFTLLRLRSLCARRLQNLCRRGTKRRLTTCRRNLLPISQFGCA